MINIILLAFTILTICFGIFVLTLVNSIGFWMHAIKSAETKGLIDSVFKKLTNLGTPTSVPPPADISNESIIPR